MIGPGIKALAATIAVLFSGHNHYVPPARPLPVKMYDALSASALPKKLPRGALVAPYGNGLYRWPQSALRRLHREGHPTLCIDVWGTMPRCPLLDVEPGDATPQQAAQWTRERDRLPHLRYLPIVYVNRSTYPVLVNTMRADRLKRGRNYMLWVTTGGSGVPYWGAMQYNVAVQNTWKHHYDQSVVWSSSFVRAFGGQP